MTHKPKPTTVVCPHCGRRVEKPALRVDETKMVKCTHCGAKFAVIGRDKLYDGGK